MMRVAHGRYHYFRDGQRTAITEPWSLSRSATGWLLQGQRLDGDRVLFDIEADYRADLCIALRLRWATDTPHTAQTLRYAHEGDALRWQRQGDDAMHREPLPAGCRLFPLLRVATAPLLPQLATASGWLVLPSLHDPRDDRRFLQPVLSERRAEAGGIDIAGAAHYRYFGGEYGDAGCDCWLNAQHLLQRYRWHSPQGHWEVQLEDAWTAANFSGWC
jgi:hypothetical protein